MIQKKETAQEMKKKFIIPEDFYKFNAVVFV